MVTFAASTGTAIAMGLAGIIAVLVVCAAFYAIGRSEDRDRAATAPPAETPPEPAAEGPAPQPPAPPRSRAPGRRRRP